MRSLFFQCIFMIVAITYGGHAMGDSCRDIVVANEGANFKPFYFYEEGSDKKTGFELELLRAILDRTCYNYLITDKYEEARVNITFPKVGPMLIGDLFKGLYTKSLNGGFAWDMVSSTFGITEERQEFLDFSNPIFKPRKGFFGDTTAIEIDIFPNSLGGLKIGASVNTLFYQYLEHLNEAFLASDNQIKIMPFGGAGGSDPAQDAMRAVVAGTIDLATTDIEVFEEFIKENDIDEKFGHVGPELTSSVGGEKLSSGVGFVFRKGNDRLHRRVNKGLKKVLSNCEYTRLFQKYFDYRSPLSPEHCR